MNEYKYHDGGECPVESGTKVDVIHRDGERYGNQTALMDHSDSFDFAAREWDHQFDGGDIIAWRLSEVGE